MLLSGMKTLLARGAMVLCLLPVALRPVTAQTPSFEDLVRRAQAALDSRPAEAAGLYRQALGIRPTWAEGWFYLGAALYQTDRYAEASDAFRKGLELSPKVGSGWAFLGLCEAELDNIDQALSDIGKGLELGVGDNWPFQVAVRVKAAQLYIRSASFDQALAQLHPLALHGENSPGLVDTMGLCALGIPAALSEIPPQRRAVVELAGKAAWALADQRPAEALAAYRQLLEKYPNEPGVHYAYGLYLMETDLAGALAEFQREVRNNPKHWPTLILLGSLQTRQGAAEAAIQTLRLALKTVPAKQRWLCHAELGQAYVAADKVDAAIPEFEAAVRLKPMNAPMHYLLLQAYRRAGRQEDAEKQAAEFRKLKVKEDPLGVPGLLPEGQR
jgi:tetratricopeptide (TPR) repeat protein